MVNSGSITREKKPRGIRKPLSCTECRRRKLKCDRNQPCSTCIKREVANSCSYRNDEGRDGSQGRIGGSGRVGGVIGGGIVKQDGRPVINNGYEDIQTHILQIESLLQEVRSKSTGLDSNIAIPPPNISHQSQPITVGESNHSTGETDPGNSFSPPLNEPVSVSSTDSGLLDRRPSEASYGSEQSPASGGLSQDSTIRGGQSAGVSGSQSKLTSSAVSSITAGDTLTAMAGIQIQRGEASPDSSRGRNTTNGYGGEIISSSSTFTIPSLQLTALVDQVNLLKNALILNGGASTTSTPNGITNGNNQDNSPTLTTFSGPLSTSSSISGASSGGYSMSSSSSAPNPWFQPQGHGFPFLIHGIEYNSSTSSVLDELLNHIPPIPICDYLIQEYLMVVSNVFHVMYSPYIEERYQNFRNHLETKKNPKPTLPILGLLFALFDSAVAYLGDDDKGLNELCKRYDYYANEPLYTMSGIFRSSALQCLVADNFLLNHNILTVQTLLVILDTSLHKDADDGPCFPIFGLIISMALTLGCNTDLEEGSPYIKGGISVIEREERHRCWAGILLIDNLQTCLFGRPSMAISLSSPGCLPMNTNDFYLKMGNYEPIVNNTELTHMSFILSKVKIGSVFADVYARMRHKRPFTYEEVLGIDRVCRASKEEWDMPYKSNRGYTQLSEVKYDILHNLLDQNLLLLHRPFFNLHEESRIKCIKSATDIIDRLKRFCHDPLYHPFSIYTRGLGLFYCFHSSVILALAVAQEIVAHRDPFKIFQDFDLGLSIIQQQLSVSQVAERSSTVLSKFR